jgi:hypothetical protein
MIHADMWTLLAEDKPDLPFGIRVALPDFDRLGLRGGDSVSVRAGFVGIGSRLVIDCRHAPRWMAARTENAEPGLNRRLAVVARMARGRSWREAASMAGGMLLALQKHAFAKPKACHPLAEVVARVVGRGPGATPSGDDVLLGILAVVTSPHAGAAGVRATKSISQALLPLLPTTTEVSGQLLRQATNGLFGRDIHELISALLGASPRQLLCEKVRRVIESGATSGADTCEGMLAFAPFFFRTDNERVSI